MKRLLPSLLLLAGAILQLTAQNCPPPGFPDAGDDCPSAPILCVTLDGYCNEINNNNIPQNFPGCGGNFTLNNDEWFAFYAGSTTITIEVVPSNCGSGFFPGLQAGIYYGCGGPVMDVQCDCEEDPFTLSSTNFIIGEIYWMVLDGCAGDVCDYTINVLEGSTAGGPPDDPGPLSGPITVCQGETYDYSLDPVFAATIYNWDLDPGLGTINDNDNEASITFTSPGTAELCVDTENQCFDNPTTSCITIEVLPNPTATLSGDGTICAEGAMDPAELTVTFTGDAPWEFEYSIGGVPQPPITTSDNPYTLSINTIGNVTLTSVTSLDADCPGTVSGGIQITETVITPSLTGTDPLCNGSADGSITTIISGGTAPYSFNWDPMGSGQDPTGLESGVYTVTVTDDNGCTGEANVELVDPPLLDASGSSSQDVDCNNPTGSISTTVSGGTPGYTYNWSPSGSGANPTGLPDGTYFATVTDANGCTDTLSAVVAIDTISPVAVAAAPDILTCAETTVELDGTGSSSGPNFTYQWNGPGIVSGGTTLMPTVNQPGSYTLTVTAADNGCTGMVTVTVGQDITPPVAVATAPPLTCANTEIQIDGTGTDTGPNFTYSWNGPGIVSGGTTLMPTVNQPGTYTLTVTNSDNGCETDLSVTVTEDTDPPAANASAPPLTCNDTEVVIDGSGSATGPGITYLWSGPGIVSGETTLMPTVNQPGTYTLEVTNADNGCIGTVSVTVDEQTDPPAAVASAPPITCSSPSISISGAGSSTGPDFSYQWTTNDGNIVSGDMTLNPTVDQPGTYTLTVVNDVTGCENTVSVTVDEDITPPLAEAGPTFELTCAITDLTLDGTGSDTGTDFTYQWSGPGIVSGGNTLMPTVNQPGTYTITVTNIQNGCTETDQVTVTQDITPPVATGTAPPITCAVTEVTIDGTGSSTGAPGFTYSWSGPGIVSGGTTLMPTVNQPGTYTLTVTNSDNGCEETATVTVQDQTQLPDAAATADPFTCVVNQININGTGSSIGPDFTYLWTTGDGNIVNGETTLAPLVDQTGTYTLTVLNNSTGCENDVSITVGIDTIPPLADAGPPAQLDCGDPTVVLDGSLSSSGPPGFTYQWSGPGIIGNNTNSSVSVNAPGTYTIQVTNAENGCIATDEVEVISDFTLPNIAIEDPEVITCFVPSILLDATASDSGPNFSYQWFTPNGNIISGATTPTPEVGSGGQYILTLTNSDNECSNTFGVFVTEDTAPPIANAGPNGLITCAISELPLFGSGSSFGPEFTYLWTTNDGNILSGETSLTPFVNQEGTYTITVTNNDNGCESTATTQVFLDSDVPVADAGPDLTITCQQPVPVLDGTGSTSGPSISYTWTTVDGNIVAGVNTPTPQVDQPGTYQLQVVDQSNGCVSLSSVVVDEDVVLPTADILPPGEVNCTTPEITLDASGSSSVGSFSYVWNTADGNIVSGQGTLMPVVDQGGTYELTVINNTTGCFSEVSVLVNEDIDNPSLVINPPGIVSCTDPELVIDASGSDMGPDLQYSWTTGDGNIVSGEDSATPIVSTGGTYVLVITNQSTNCFTTDSVVVQENADLPTVAISPATELNCTVNQTQLDASIGGGSDLSFTWSTNDGNIVAGDNTLAPTVDEPGSYLLEVLNNQTGCANSTSIVVTQDVQIPSVAAGPDTELNCFFNEQTLDGTGSVSGPNFQYNWGTPDGNIVSGGSTPTPVVDAGGTYILTVVNTQNTCQNTDTLAVSENFVAPTTTVEAPGLLGCVDTIQQLDAGGSSVGTNFVYQWTTGNGNILSGANTLVAEVDAPGTYNLLITDTLNGCTSSIQALVEQNTDIPQVDAGPDGELTCVVSMIQLSGTANGQTANFAINWSTADGNIASGSNSLTPVVDQAGTYTLTVIDTINQCSATADVIITQDDDVPMAVVQPSNELDCNFATVTLDANGSSQSPNLIYEWSTTNGNFVSGADGLTPIVDQAGTYTLTITDTVNACVISETIQVVPDTLGPNLVAAPAPVLNCFFPELSLDVNAGSITDFSASWSTVDGNITGNLDSLNVLVDQPGTYDLVVVNNENGCSSTLTTTVDANFTLPDVNAGPGGLIDCQTTSLNLAGTADGAGAPLQLSWTTLDGSLVNGDTTLTPLINAGGTYTLTVLNTLNGCTDSSAVTIQQDQDLPLLNVVPPAILNCFEPAINLDATGSSSGTAFTYEWTTPDGNLVNGADGLTPTVDEPGVYFFSILDTTNNCTILDSVTILQDTVAPQVDAGIGGELTCSILNINMNANGSVGPEFTYNWTTLDGNILSGEDSLDPVVDAPGTYTLEVLNTQNGCTAAADATVTESNDVPAAAAAVNDTLTCTVLSLQLDGSGSAQGSNFTYEWTTADGNVVSGTNSLNPVIDQPGSYVLNVTNIDNDCVGTATIEVPIDTLSPSAEAGAVNTLTCTTTSLNLNGAGSSVGNDFSISWSTTNGSIVSGGDGIAPVVNAPGTYQITVTNLVNGCISTDATTVDQDIILPVVATSVADTLTCTMDEISISGTGSSTGPEFEYNWSTINGNILSGSSDLLPIVDQPGTYTLLVTDQSNGCQSADSVIVIQDIVVPTADAGTAGLLTCAVTSLNLNGSASGNNPILAYNWTTSNGNILSGVNTLMPAIDQPGEYILEVTDLVNGCVTTAAVTVDQDTIAPTIAIADPGQLTCAIDQILLDAMSSSGGPDFQINWSTPNGNIVSGLTSLMPTIDQAGTYNLVIENLINGCINNDQVQVEIDTIAPVVDAGNGFVLPCLEDEVELDGSVIANTSNLDIQWTTLDGQLQGGTTTLTPTISSGGQYSLTIINLENGCQDTDDVLITEDFPLPPDVLANQPPCAEDLGSLIVDAPVGGSPPYLYSIDGGETYFPNNAFTGLVEGNYEVVVQDLLGCESVPVATFIDQPDPLVVELGTETTILQGESYQFQLQLNVSEDQVQEVIWTPITGLSCTDCLDPIASPLATTNYLVQVIIEGNCAAEDQFRVVVDERPAIYAPNIFSPNGDGNNDRFFLFARLGSVKEIRSFLVFSRWGETVHSYSNFQPNDPAAGWDGRHRGEPMNPAVFTWFAEVEMLDGRIELFEGDVTLVR
jgi:gliding motility-associated-like protein